MRERVRHDQLDAQCATYSSEYTPAYINYNEEFEMCVPVEMFEILTGLLILIMVVYENISFLIRGFRFQHKSAISIQNWQ